MCIINLNKLHVKKSKEISFFIIENDKKNIDRKTKISN